MRLGIRIRTLLIANLYVAAMLTVIILSARETDQGRDHVLDPRGVGPARSHDDRVVDGPTSGGEAAACCHVLRARNRHRAHGPHQPARAYFLAHSYFYNSIRFSRLSRGFPIRFWVCSTVVPLSFWSALILAVLNCYPQACKNCRRRSVISCEGLKGKRPSPRPPRIGITGVPPAIRGGSGAGSTRRPGRTPRPGGGAVPWTETLVSVVRSLLKMPFATAIWAAGFARRG